jgi:hypothetical protein
MHGKNKRDEETEHDSKDEMFSSANSKYITDRVADNENVRLAQCTGIQD